MKKQTLIYISNFVDYFYQCREPPPDSSVSLILSLVSCLPSPVSLLTVCFLPHFSHLPSPGSRLMSTASCLLLLSPFSCLPSPIFCLPSPCFPSPVSCLPSTVSRLLSHVFCLTSQVSCLTSPML